MRCSKARKLISDYVDDNLDPKKNSTLERHLEACPDCEIFLKDFQRIVKNAKELEKISPSAQAWLKIKARLKAETQTVLTPEIQKRKWFDFLIYQPKFKYALASVLLLAVIIGAVTLGIRYWKAREALWRDGNQQYTLAKLEEAEFHYQLAIKALAEAVSSQRESLEPQIAQIFRTNLEIIDVSIEACKKAVLHEPENLEARNHLLFAYRGKLDLLDEMIATKLTSSRKGELEKTL